MNFLLGAWFGVICLMVGFCAFYPFPRFTVRLETVHCAGCVDKTYQQYVLIDDSTKKKYPFAMSQENDVLFSIDFRGDKQPRSNGDYVYVMKARP